MFAPQGRALRPAGAGGSDDPAYGPRYEARARRGLFFRPCPSGASPVAVAVPVPFRFPWLRRMAIAEAMKTVEYVPLTMPTSIVNAKPRSASPPKIYRESTERNVVPAVMIVRSSV